MIHFTEEKNHHGPEIEALVEASFGPARFQKTVYKFREQVAPMVDLGLVMIDETTGRLVATLRFWPLLLPNGVRTPLLGPLAVDETLRGCGLGRKLMWNGITRARARGYQNIILVGDPEYYHQFGFTHDVVRGLSLPGWVDLRRFLGLEFKSGSLLSQRGFLRPVTQATESEQAVVEEDRPVAFKDDPIFLRSFA